MDKKSTIHDVARKARVSIATVSRVLNKQHTGSAEVREQVIKAATAIGYVPNQAARLLAARGGMEPKGFLVHSAFPKGDYFGDIFEGAEKEAKKATNGLIFSERRSSAAVMVNEEITPDRIGREVRGLLLAGPPDVADFGSEAYRELRALDIPVVFINTYPPDERANTVMCDNFTATYRAVKWLVELGHRHIACISTTGNTPVVERVMGYRQALFDSGIRVRPEWIQYVYEAGVYSPQAGQQAMKVLNELTPRPTAVFGAVDAWAVGAVQYAKAVGLRIPEDLSVLGMNDLDIAAQCDPPLTSIRIHRQEMGRVAVRRLSHLLRHMDEEPIRIDVLCERIVRASCGKVPAPR